MEFEKGLHYECSAMPKIVIVSQVQSQWRCWWSQGETLWPCIQSL